MKNTFSKIMKNCNKIQAKLNKNTNKLIQDQELFLKREQIVLNLLKFYFNDESYNPITKNIDKSFTLIFSDELLKALDFDDSNVEWVPEFLFDFADAVQNGIKINNKMNYIKIEGNGIFSVFKFTKNKKQKLSLDDAIKLTNFSNFQGF